MHSKRMASVRDETPLSLAYRVEGRESLLRDGVAHKFRCQCRGRRRVCVEEDERRVHQRRIEDASKHYELLAGPASVPMDDSFVMKTRLRVSPISWCLSPKLVLTIYIPGLNSLLGCTSRSRACLESALHSGFPIGLNPAWRTSCGGASRGS